MNNKRKSSVFRNYLSLDEEILVCDDIPSKSIPLRRLDRPNKPLSSYLSECLQGRVFVVVPNCSYSDYSGCAVERSNYRTIKELFPFIHTFWGGYNTEGLLVEISDWFKYRELRKIVCSLSDYPVIDDDDLSRVENELQEEAWSNFVCHDTISALDNYFTDNPPEWLTSDTEDVRELIESIPDLYSIFLSCTQEVNTYFEIETGGSVYIDIDKIIPVLAKKVSLLIPDIIDPTKPDAIQLSLEL